MTDKTQKSSPRWRGQLELLIVLAVALVWRVWSFQTPPSTGYDEAIYLHYAQIVAEQGLDGMRALIADARNDPWLKLGPPPFRVLYIVLAATGCKLMGGFSVAHLALLSALFGFASIVLAAILFRGWLGARAGLLAALLLAFSPLMTALSRRALQDSYFGFLILLAVYAFDRCLCSGSRANLLALTAALLACFLSKESCILFYPGFLLVAAWLRPPGDWRSLRRLGLPFLLAPLLALLVEWLASGSAATMTSGYSAYIREQGRNAYALTYQTGPWFRYWIDLALLLPFGLALAVIGAAARDLPEILVRGHRFALGFSLAGFFALSCLSMLNVRFVSPLEPFLAALATIGIHSLAQRIPDSRLKILGYGVISGLLVVSEITAFKVIFQDGGVYDPVTANLVHAWHLSP